MGRREGRGKDREGRRNEGRKERERGEGVEIINTLRLKHNDQHFMLHANYKQTNHCP